MPDPNSPQSAQAASWPGGFDLNTHPVDVLALTTPNPAPHLAIGSAVNSEFGPRVLLGVGSPATDGTAYAQIAHMSPALADELADQLKAAAAEVRKALS